MSTSSSSSRSCPFRISDDWAERLKEDLEAPYMWQLVDFVRAEREAHAVFPPKELVFNALNLTPFESVKVVIMGQDPYHGPGQAMGLSFSVPRGTRIPPSLQNILKEQVQDVGIQLPQHGSLEKWAQQGVLLLNATLTVRSGQPKSHYGQGWERLTDAILQRLWERPSPTVFLLWGSSAQEKCRRVMHDVDASPHLVLRSVHPSPLSAHRGYFGSRHFSQTNHFLEERGLRPIDWQL
jgi:uracil-DNA glycosylase